MELAKDIITTTITNQWHRKISEAVYSVHRG